MSQRLKKMIKAWITLEKGEINKEGFEMGKKFQVEIEEIIKDEKFIACVKIKKDGGKSKHLIPIDRITMIDIIEE